VWKKGDSGTQRLLADRPLWDWGLHLPSEFRQRRYRKVLPVVLRDLLSNAVGNPRALMRAGELARTADLREELSELAQRGLPVSILWGTEDTVVPEATFLSLCEAAGSEGDIIEDAGHSWLLADPEGFGELLTNSVVHHTTLTERSPGAAERWRDDGPDAESAFA
jgi:pimeloyl-ACP methyl ester carboxylesterase